jgi:hypothetical protein
MTGLKKWKWDLGLWVSLHQLLLWQFRLD